MKKYILFGVIASVLTINAYAVSATVTSKDYVDTQDALKQDLIPEAETNLEIPGISVVTYTSTAGTIGERGIFDSENDIDWDNGGIVEGHEGDLVTAGDVQSIYDAMTPTTIAADLRCYQWDPVTNDCLLWSIRASRALDGGGNCRIDSEVCYNDDDCCSNNCNNGRCYTDSI